MPSHPDWQGTLQAMNFPQAPASYSGSLRPGEYPHLSIHEGGPRLTMVGEASSRELQGYLEGALRSADEGVTRFLRARLEGTP